MKTWDVTVVGRVGVHEVAPGPGGRRWRCLGEGAGKAAWAARLGGKAALIGVVGLDAAGDECRRQLQDAGVEVGGLVTELAAATEVLGPATGGGATAAAPRFAEEGALRAFHVQGVGCLIAGAGTVLLGGEVAADAIGAALAAANAAGVPVVFQPGARLPSMPLQGRRVHSVVAGEDELVDWLGRLRFPPVDEIEHLVVVRRGGPAIVLGRNGQALLGPYVGDVPLDGPARDAFGAAYALALAQGRNLAAAVGYAQLVARHAAAGPAHGCAARPGMRAAAGGGR